MGLLSDMGPIEDFENTMKQQGIIKKIGLRQFMHRLRLYAKWKKPADISHIKWGEQIQGHFLCRDQKGGLWACREDIDEQYSNTPFPIFFEYGTWMFEMIPSGPYRTDCNFYDTVESIRQKYQYLHSKSRLALTIPVLPILGYRDPNNNNPFVNEITQSKYIDDPHIAGHPRFKFLTKHIRMRRQHTVQVNVPVFWDKNTTKEELSLTEPDPNFIYMDAMAFGMGNCSLQCTFSTKDLDHARYVYDQSNVLSPLFLALTAGSPIFKGKLAAWDARWNSVADAVDDRTPNQRNPDHSDFLPVSRYNEANYYLWDNPINKPEYNDFKTGVKEEDIERVREIAKEEEVEIDEKLAYHIAYLFKRDVLLIHSKFKQMDKKEFIIFDMLNGTNWNSVRLKIPIDDDIGWRVEFRTMEILLTADQNAAYSLLIYFFMRELHETQDLNLYIPISLVRENFKRAHLNDAVRQQKFYFRTNIFDSGKPVIRELTLKEIFFGNQEFTGLMKEVQKRLEKCSQSSLNVQLVINSLKVFLREVVSGERLTLAQYMRRFVHEHPEYTHNSILSKRVMDDLLDHLYRISTGEVKVDNFRPIFPTIQSKQRCCTKQETQCKQSEGVKAD